MVLQPQHSSLWNLHLRRLRGRLHFQQFPYQRIMWSLLSWQCWIPIYQSIRNWFPFWWYNNLGGLIFLVIRRLRLFRSFFNKKLLNNHYKNNYNNKAYDTKHMNDIIAHQLLLDPHWLLLVHVGQHQRNVGGQEVVHFVAQRRLTQQFGASNQVTNGHVEIGVTRWPIWNSGKWMGHQDFLKRSKEKRVLLSFFR